jgi:hypothetical protein
MAKVTIYMKNIYGVTEQDDIESSDDSDYISLHTSKTKESCICTHHTRLR